MPTNGEELLGKLLTIAASTGIKSIFHETMVAPSSGVRGARYFHETGGSSNYRVGGGCGGLMTIYCHCR